MMIWVRRFLVGTGLAAASLFATPLVAHAADTGCYTCTPPTIDNNQGLPFTAGPASGPVTPTAAGPSSPSSSLPFTGADVAELTVIGAGAVVIGGVMVRRRRVHA